MVSPKVGFIIQARMNSSRLKGKILLPLPFGSSTSLLEQIILRAKAVRENTTIILATSLNPENQILAEVAQSNHVAYYQGSEDNVLERFYLAATEHNLDLIVRLTADNPFIDSEIVDSALQSHVITDSAYTLTQGLPVGTNIEVISYAALQKTYQQATLPEHREHVTPYLRQNKDLFKINYLVFHDSGYGQPSWRLTVDNESDYALACLLYQQVVHNQGGYSLKQITKYIYANPWALGINKNNYQKKVFSTLTEEIQAAIVLLKNNDLPNAARMLEQQI